jgi:hypothetical protein
VRVKGGYIFNLDISVAAAVCSLTDLLSWNR